jgi:hypothetical protein
MEMCTMTFLPVVFEYFVANAFISQVNTQTMHVKPSILNSIAIISLQTVYPGGIRTQVSCSCSSLPEQFGLGICNFH